MTEKYLAEINNKIHILRSYVESEFRSLKKQLRDLQKKITELEAELSVLQFKQKQKQ